MLSNSCKDQTMAGILILAFEEVFGKKIIKIMHFVSLFKIQADTRMGK